MGELYVQFIKNERFTARIDGWASDGSGVCHVGGRAVFANRDYLFPLGSAQRAEMTNFTQNPGW